MLTISPLIGTTLCWCLAVYSSILLSPVSHADIQFWIDDKGQRHFSDRPNQHSQSYQPETPVQALPAEQLPRLRNNNEHDKAKQKQRQKQAKALAQQQAKLKKQCDKIDTRIRQINAKLRRSHSNDQGNTWRRQRREYQNRRYKLCR